MTEIFYYHLTKSKVENALPALLEKAIQKEYRIVVQVGNKERCEAIDDLLWTYKDDNFLVHSAEGSGDNPEDQPIWITTDNQNANGANLRFLIDNAEIQDPEQYERVIRMFDGHDTEAVDKARQVWKQEKEAGHKLAYWQQDDSGKWVNKTQE